MTKETDPTPEPAPEPEPADPPPPLRQDRRYKGEG